MRIRDGKLVKAAKLKQLSQFRKSLCCYIFNNNKMGGILRGELTTD